MRNVLLCGALAFLAVGCNSNSTPTDPSQVNIEFTTTELITGTGAEAVRGSTATVDYTLWLYDPNGPESKGTFLDTSVGGQPLPPFVVGAQRLIPGFEQAVLGMRVGGKRRAYIPSNLAYGGSGSPDGRIPPNAAVVFEIELVNVT